ncbi:putative dehydrogenase [Microbacterium natoriense]|uniref:Dehydrogenase n=1 Tax=Microbacterium natoriense TaxID=284570 RepID=A0AAW8ESN7_9MICO|nr:Gfo/Idh/MocA family oxidoreductase [Microbacterium natoriense]MDQ0646137.1 putative dehydrogenase [Microbacterium natoriense]
MSHFSKGADDGPRGDVENEDYAAILARFDSGAVAVLESSRVAIGPRAEYRIEVYGTKGSLRWDFQRLNELQLADDTSGYRTVMAGPDYGDFARFQPGAGTGMGFDDLKTIEASLFLRSVAEGRQLAPSASDAWSAAEIVDAALAEHGIRGLGDRARGDGADDVRRVRKSEAGASRRLHSPSAEPQAPKALRNASSAASVSCRAQPSRPITPS